ncbi:MAG: rhodanese-like domain-containing protein [Gammaproteobacteria bacterium]
MYAINEIDSADLKSWQAENKEFVLLDVRTPNEIFQGIIAGGVGLPLNQIPYQVEQLPKDTPVVFYCRTGARSAQATAFLMARGFDNAYNLRGGIMDWARQGGAIVAPEPSMMEQMMGQSAPVMAAH